MLSGPSNSTRSGDGGLRSKRAHDTQNLALGAVLGERQELAMVFFREMWGQQDERGEVQLAIGNQLKDDGKTPS